MVAKPKSELMARLRAQRKEAGLRRIEYWLTEDEQAKVDAYLRDIRKGG